MALNISQGSGATVATDVIGSLHYGYNKIVDGTVGSNQPWNIDSSANASGAGHVVLRGNATLSDSKGYIGLTTVTPGSAWPDPKTYIGLATTTPGSAWPDPKAFIGLATVKASVLDTYASLATLTISLASIASSAAGVGRQATLVNNATTKYTSANIYLKLETGGSAPTANSLIYVYLIRYDNNTVADDGAGTSDAGLTIVNAPLLGTILVSTTGTNTFYYGVFNTAFLGSLGPQWGIAVVNSSGAALNGTESNMLKNWIGLNPQLT